MTVIDSLPSRPLHGDTILALNEAEPEMAVMPISYYEEVHIYSMVMMNEEQATVVGFNGEEWTILSRTEPDSNEVFDPEQVIDEWARETHPDLYGDPAFEITSDDYDLE